MISYLLKIISSFTAILCIIKVLTKYRRFCAMLPLYAVYNFTLVMPIIVEIFMGIPQRGYIRISMALNDNLTTIIYCIFITFGEIYLYRALKRQSLSTIRKPEFIQRNEQYITIFERHKSLIILMSVCIWCSFIIGIAFAPNTMIYFTNLSAFSMDLPNRTAAEIQYHNIIIRNLMNLTAFSLIAIRFTKPRGDIRAVQWALIILITLVNGKRTFTMMLIGVLLIIDYTEDNRKINLLKLVSVVGIVGGYFVIYAYITGKFYLNSDWYSTVSEYFFRSEHTRVALYSILYPDSFKILDYPCQTILYNLFYILPRSIWINKPYPYPVYYTSCILNYDKNVILDWRFQTSYWAEFISNFGLLGLPIALVFTKKMGIFFNKRSRIVKVLGAGLISLLQIYEYSDMLKMLSWVLIVLLLCERTRISGSKLIIQRKRR